MEFREQVLDLLAEVAENNIVKENPDVEIFEEGIIDSFQTVGSVSYTHLTLPTICSV